MAPVQEKYGNRIRAIMTRNFFIWLIPGFIIFSISVILVVILASAAATGFDGDPLKKVPKSLLSFLGPAYLLAALAAFIIAIVYTGTDIEGKILLIATGLALLILGYYAMKYEVKRLREYCIQHPE